MQRELKVRNAELPAEQRIAFRMGIHVGEIVADGEQLHGDGINIAVRLESLAEAGGILISGTVYDQVKTKLALQYEALGEQHLKNIAEPVRVWRIVLDGSESPKSKVQSLKGKVERQKPRKVSLSVFVFVLVSVLLIAGLVTFWFSSLSPFSIPHSAFRTQEAQPPSLPLPDKPSIVVLPFVNMSGDPEQEYFSDGLTEDLTSDLSILSGLFVIARNSAFTYKGKAVKVQEVSREMGVRYVLEGSVRKSGDRVRVTAQLIDGTTGGHLWSERYDRPLTDIFSLQDEIRQQLMAALRVKVTEAELERVRRIPTENLTAYDSFLRGMEYSRRLTKEMNLQARQMFERAIELDPQFAAAYAAVSWIHYQDWLFQWSPDPNTLEQALAEAQKAVALNDSLPFAHTTLGHMYLWKKQHDQAIAAQEKAIALDPNCAFCYSELGETMTYVGRPQEALGLLEKAIRLSPHEERHLSYRTAYAYHWLGRSEEAIAICKKAVAHYPDFLGVHYVLAIIYSELGREAEARAAVAEILRLSPTFSLEAVEQRLAYKDPAMTERELAALRKAGLK
jgi:adenylate cyclase